MKYLYRKLKLDDLFISQIKIVFSFEYYSQIYLKYLLSQIKLKYSIKIIKVNNSFSK